MHSHMFEADYVYNIHHKPWVLNSLQLVGINKIYSWCWISETTGGSVTQKEVLRLRKENQQLQDENSLIKIKMELLLDMVL